MEEELLENINKSLEVIIGLLLRGLPDSDTAHVRGRILMLRDLGMRPREIARVLGKTENHINVVLSHSRKPAKERRKK
jgi:hypothetical protein